MRAAVAALRGRRPPDAWLACVALACRSTPARGAASVAGGSGGNAGGVSMPARVGDEHALTRAFTPADVAAFVALTGDANALHTCDAAAAAAGFAGSVLPGILTASLFPGLIGTAFPGAVYARQELAFVAPAMVAKPVTARVTVDSVAPPRATRGGGGRRARVTFRTRAFSGGVLAVDGTAVALLPVE